MTCDPSPEQLRYRLLPYIEKTYVLESLALNMLDHHADRFLDYADVHARLRQFAEQTERHLIHLEQLLVTYDEQAPYTGGKPPFSFLKGTPIAVLEEVLPSTSTFDAFDNYCYTQFEIAILTLLDTMARVFGDERAIMVAEEILADKTEMQRWLLGKLPDITLRSLSDEGIKVPLGAWEYARTPEVAAMLAFASSDAALW